ncbi:MAG: alpha/beta hydrolase [Pseudomonadales bacterium]|nr:alpha/beta hydrolase [Pseudomonadales bacterium]
MPYVTVNNARLWYDAAGEGAPILLHHGYTASRDNWQPVGRILEHKYRVVIMECRGCGQSEHTEEGNNLEQFAEDAVALMRELGHDTFTFVGHSMGGGVGMTIAIKHPEALDKLVLVGSVSAKGLIGQSFRTNVEQRLAARKARDRDFFLREQRDGFFRPDVQTEAWFEKRIHHMMHVISERHLVDAMQSMQSMDYTEALAGIETPTLVIAGGVDPLMKTNIEDYQRLPNAALHIFSRAAHEIGIHETEGTAKAIDEFMQHGPLNADTLKRR